MLPLAIVTAVILVAIFASITLRALHYVGQHPELITNDMPPAYARCQHTLLQIIDRCQLLETLPPHHDEFSWHAPSGFVYRITDAGIEERREGAARSHAYFLRWHDIGGVGLRMQPGFRLVDRDGDGYADSQYTVDYAFYLLVVPLHGRSINVQVPTDHHQDALNFVAHTLMLAQRKRRRISVFGFDKPPAPYHRKVPKT